MHQTLRRRLTTCVAPLALLANTSTLFAQGHEIPAKTPIQHIVVIFQENVSFDHYFGTYPHAKANADGTTLFGGPRDDTPRANTLESAGLLENNPNKANPFRLDRSTPKTCDQDHDYGSEQAAFHSGLMDQFVQQTGCVDPILGPNIVMGYFDGNTVTAFWNYAQYFAMSDNFFGTSFGPSTPGALNLISGTTYAGTITNGLKSAGNIAGGANTGAVIGDPDPADDICSNPARTQITMSGQNVGDLLNKAGVSWGSFMGGFADCKALSTGITGSTTTDYIPHHAWFQYWRSTANPKHTRPTSVASIGHAGDAANHGYDLSDFWSAVKANNMPAVSFLKARAIQDGHAGYSDPLDEQQFVVDTINALEKTPEWKNTAVIVTYDDSDGWYDHVMGPIVNQSNVSDDRLFGAGSCGTPKAAVNAADIQNGRCGYGPRLPLLVISPYARRNYIDHSVTDFASILRFMEDNWNLGRIGNGSADAIAGTLDGLFDFDHAADSHKLILDPSTGKIIDAQPEERGGPRR